MFIYLNSVVLEKRIADLDPTCYLLSLDLKDLKSSRFKLSILIDQSPLLLAYIFSNVIIRILLKSLKIKFL